MEQILLKLKDKNNKINSMIDKMIELDNNNNNNNNNINNITEIYNNIDETYNNVQKYYYLLMDKSDVYKSIEDEKRIREIKINEQIQKTLLPYMIMMKMTMEPID